MLEQFIDIYFTILFFCLKMFAWIIIIALVLMGILIAYLVVKYHKKKK